MKSFGGLLKCEQVAINVSQQFDVPALQGTVV
jgi:hypothetical protein